MQSSAASLAGAADSLFCSYKSLRSSVCAGIKPPTEDEGYVTRKEVYL